MKQNEMDLQSSIIDIERLLQLSPEELRMMREKERPCPDVQFDRLTLELKVYHGKACYEIDLERCSDPGQILDWIFQLCAKTWMTHDLMGQIVRALDNACHEVFDDGIQGVFCPGGVARQANWKSIKTNPQGNHRL